MPSRSAKSAEAAEQQVVLDWLAVKGILAFRMNSGFHLAVNEKTGKKRAIRYGVVGMGDILAFPWFPGDPFPRTVWIEMKRRKCGKQRAGKQSPEQKSFQQQVEDAGLYYLVVEVVEELEQWLMEMSNSIQTKLNGTSEPETATK